MAESVRCASCELVAWPGDVFCRRCGQPLGRVTVASRWPGSTPIVTAPPEAGLDTTAAEPAPTVQGALLRARREDAASEATRFLSAGAYLDQGFARQVVKELFGQTFRAVAPSYGFDVGVVAGHCLAVRRMWRIRDWLLAGVLVLMLLLGWLPTVVGGIAWLVIGKVISALSDGTGGLRRAIDRLSWRSVLYVVVVWWVPLLLFFLLGYILLAAGLLVVASIVAGAVAGGTGWVVLYAIVLAEMVVRRRTVVRHLRRAAYQTSGERRIPLGRRLSKRLQERLDAITWGQVGNVTVYSGFDPFVGAGDEVPGWSFAIPLTAAPGKAGAVEQFSVKELSEHVRRRIADIASDETGAADNALRGLVVADHVFVSGLAIDNDQRFLPRRWAPPRTRLSDEEVAQVVSDPHGAVRHYCSVQVRSWQGEIVTSVLFHFSTDGEKVYFEWVKRVLPPVRSEYHAIDTTSGRLTFGTVLRFAAEAAGSTVGLVAGAPIRAIRDFVFDHRAYRPDDDVVVDYGARLSVRMLGQEREWCDTPLGYRHNYFQALDVDKHLKIVERHAFGAILEFLEAHDIDTSEFSTRSTTILDSSVTVIGSNNTLGAVATGSGASATQGGRLEAAQRGRES